MEVNRLRALAICSATAPACIFFACAPGDPEQTGEAPARAATEVSGRPLYVSAAAAPAEREAFVAALQTHEAPLRALYAGWIERIGANGILDGIESLRPRCHSEAHDLGKVVYALLGEIGASLRACDRRCHSGCMHGVLMEAFTAACSVDGQLRFELLAPSVELVCAEEPQMRAHYSQGDCAHGVGHALMFLSDYRVPQALDGCRGFREETMRYYCATGAYMEFVTAGRADATLREARFSPCDTHPYPAACARYLMPRLLHFEMQSSGSPQRAVDACLSQQGAARLGCFHGLGNAFMPYVVSGGTKINDACLRFAPDEQRMCIEGVVERMSRYEPERALEVCVELAGEPRRICNRARENRMYAPDKDLRLYVTSVPDAP